MEACENGQSVSAAERLIIKRKFLKESKLKIAKYCSLIIEDPNENVGRLRDLLKMTVEPLFMKSENLRLLLIASLCVVFKDILPSYKIRLATDQENQQQATKETRRMRRFEEILLNNYEKYVLLLQTILKDKGRRKLPKSLRSYLDQTWSRQESLSALKCSCQLFENNPRFNYSEDLIRSSLPFLQEDHSSVRQIVMSSLYSLFSTDISGEATLTVCRRIHQLARTFGYRILPDVANVLAGISIKEVAKQEDFKNKKKERKTLSRKQRKKDKVLAKFEKDQSESKASKSHEERLKINSEILKEILFVYFKVLKNTKDSDLLSAVLAGLSSYAHIINVEYVENLLQLFSGIISNAQSSLHDGLHCVHTSLAILNVSSASSVLNVDPTSFYNHLYTLLGRMAGVSDVRASAVADRSITSLTQQYEWARTPATMAAATLARGQQLLIESRCKQGKNKRNNRKRKMNGDDNILEMNDEGKTSGGRRGIPLNDTERFTDVVLACLDMLLISRKRDVSTNRVLAFVKRLASLSISVSDTSCIGSMLVSLLKIVTLFPKCEVLLDSDTEIGGVYDASAPDPELARPASAVLWELHLLRTHESPMIRKIVSVILRWMKHMASGDSNSATPHHTGEVVAHPVLTMEALTQLHPAQRRVALAKSEAAYLTTQSTVKCCTSHYVPSPWLREAMREQGITGNVRSFRVPKQNLIEEDLQAPLPKKTKIQE